MQQKYDISYSKYRIHLEELAHKKRQLEGVITKKREAHAVYRKAWKEYNTYSEQQDNLVHELMEAIPSRI